jgi:uncharacterized membrane protein
MRRLAVRRHLLAGILILLPLWLTVVLGRWVFEALASVSEPGVRPLFDWLQDGAGIDLEWLRIMVGAILTVAVVYVAGVVGTRLIGMRLHGAIDRLVTRIPLVQTVYGSIKTLTNVLMASPEKAQRVVLIESPRSGRTSIGLVTRVLTDAITGREYAAVYVPTTPNPTSGSLELIPIEEAHPSDISLDEAISFVLSGGAVPPDRFRDPEDD